MYKKYNYYFKVNSICFKYFNWSYKRHRVGNMSTKLKYEKFITLYCIYKRFKTEGLNKI